MSEMQHTPGPWIATPDPQGFTSDDYLIGEEGGPNLDGVATCSKRDAPLISTAPRLLAALIAAERLFDHTWAMDGTIHKEMKAAIKEATTSA